MGMYSCIPEWVFRAHDLTSILKMLEGFKHKLITELNRKMTTQTTRHAGSDDRLNI